MAFAGFLVLMWVFTLISKAIYVSGLPMVKVEKPGRKYVDHHVEVQGMVVQGGEWAVIALDGLRIEKIYVRQGDRIEAGMPLFCIDTDDLKEIIEEQELAITRLQYQISDIKANQALAEQQRQITQERAREDYAAADNQTGTAASRAEEAKDKADTALQEHIDHPVAKTSETKRKQAWEKYNNWVNQQKELNQKIAQSEKIITNLENPEDGRELTETEEAELAEEKSKLADLRDALKEHEKNQVDKPDFSSEDSALAGWQTERENLADMAEQADYSREDAYTDRDSALKQAGRDVEDTLLPEDKDSTLAINELELADLKRQLGKYQEILDHNGEIMAQASGTVTDIGISVGSRTSGTAAMLVTDDTVPCQFKVILNTEQKKYVNLGDAVEVKLDRSISRLDMTIDYITESEMNPGTYEAYLNLPESLTGESGMPGLGGTMNAVAVGEQHECCIPVEALYKVDEGYYIYVLRERESILGKELYAERISVTVLDRNNTYAALEAGAVNRDSEVITFVTEEIARGDVVKYLE